MNIFVTDPDPIKCAKYLDNKRVVKMVLESTQMLSTAINELGGQGPYRSTHKNHPCNQWVRKSRANYLWLLNHLKALCSEYTRRYDKIHKCEQYIPKLEQNACKLPDRPQTEFVNCAANQSLGLSFKHNTSVFKAYRNYLKARWALDKRKPQWK